MCGFSAALPSHNRSLCARHLQVRSQEALVEEAQRIDEECGLIVQLPLSSFWGTAEEYDHRNEVADALDRLFQQSGCGTFDGTDTGEGKTNLFIYGIADGAFDQAVALVLGELRRRGLLERAIVARTELVGDPEDPWAQHTVVWPENFRGEFRV
jgi:hypothetical protein